MRGTWWSGPHSGVLLIVAAITAGLDQANKIWLLRFLEMERRELVEVTSFFNLRMVWNKGVSYGLFAQDSEVGRWALIAVSIAICALLFFWLGRTASRWGAVALGLIIGGAIGNGIDRFAYGAVADFYEFHIGSLTWYVFNLADAAIVAGVALLLYEALVFHRPASQP